MAEFNEKEIGKFLDKVDQVGKSGFDFTTYFCFENSAKEFQTYQVLDVIS